MANRLTSAMRHLRARLEGHAADIAGTIRRGSTVLFENVPLIRTAYEKTVRIDLDSEDSARYHVFLISTARVPDPLLAGDLLTIGNETYRLTADKVTGQTWIPHGEHELLRAYFFILWSTV